MPHVVALLLFSEVKMSDNPLKDLYRSKSVYLNLPSGGRFYNSGLNLSIDNELGVMPMTAVDEIKLKSPDALFNGDALFDLFKSCVPDIALADEVPTCDVDMILMGIKVATHGEMLEVTSTCPKCEVEGEYEISLPRLMASAQPIDKENVIEIEGGVKVFVRPFSLRSQVKGNVQRFHQMRMQMILNDDLTDDDKAQMFDEALLQASAVSVQLCADNILSVEIPQDGSETVKVDSAEHIYEWVENMDSKTYEKVISRIRKLSDPRIDTDINLTCTDCQHEYKTKLELDPINFFT